MYIPDPIELMEANIERHIEAQLEGVPAGHFRCYCGRVCPDDDGAQVDARPDAAIACSKCREEMGLEW